jgi:hypothetical protein
MKMSWNNNNYDNHIPDNGTFPDPKAVDDFLVQEFQGLSFQDRNAICEEIHGVRLLAPEETPELLQESLRQLEIELVALQSRSQEQSTTHYRQTSRTSAYDRACQIPTSYIHKNPFRLRFLRTEMMNPKKAAERIVTFLNNAVELFGEQILARPLQLYDLGKDGLDCLRSGDYQPLPFRDRSGRRIIAFVNKLGTGFPLEARVSSGDAVPYCTMKTQQE